MSWKKRAIWSMGAILPVLAVSVVGYAPSRAIDLKDATHRPLSGYAAYYHVVDRFGTVHSTQRYASGGVLQTDTQGRIAIPGRFVLKGPLDGWPRVHVFLVYAPRQHNAVPSLPDTGIAGVMDIDAVNSVVRLHDVSSDPQRWIWSLERLYSAIRYELWPERVSTLARAKVDRETIARLVAELEDEYREFDKRYRDTRRTLPSEAELKWLPPEERTARLQVMEADIDRQPYWGPYLETRWRRQLDQLRGDLVKLSKN